QHVPTAAERTDREARVVQLAPEVAQLAGLIDPIGVNVRGRAIIAGREFERLNAQRPHATDDFVKSEIGKESGEESEFHNAGSDLELLQIVDAHPSAFKRWAIPHILLDVIMLHAFAARRDKNALPIDDAGPDLGKRIAFEAIGSGRISALEILDMQH